MPDISAIDPEMLPVYAMRVLSVLEDAGYEVWIVGGWVRDALRGDAAHDVDITTEAPWQETERALREGEPLVPVLEDLLHLWARAR